MITDGHTNVPTAPNTPVVTNNDEDELSRAIALSMQDQRDRDDFDKHVRGQAGTSYKDPSNPNERRRASLNIPAGIKNIGNTCYINSLLQAFFLVPEFRIAIFKRPLIDHVDKTEGEKLVQELQLLFTRMLLTQRQYVDPQVKISMCSFCCCCCCFKKPFFIVLKIYPLF
jgi:ubiquitin C-terminal hydrolase